MLFHNSAILEPQIQSLGRYCPRQPQITGNTSDRNLIYETGEMTSFRKGDGKSPLLGILRERPSAVIRKDLLPGSGNGGLKFPTTEDPGPG